MNKRTTALFMGMVVMASASLAGCASETSSVETKTTTASEGKEETKAAESAQADVSETAGTTGTADSSDAVDTADAGDVLIGVSMPTQSLQRWNQDGDNLQKFLSEKGYKVDLQYADNEVQTQVSQIENMITTGAKVLIIAPVDGGALSAVLSEAHENGVKVIAHDRFITGTGDVDCVATFDNSRVGELQGEFIVDKLDLKNTKESFNLEIVAGSLDDDNASYFLNGAMDVLNPYIESGQLTVQSGQTSREQCATDAWETSVAQSRMDNILTAYYTDKKVDAVLCSNDSTALGAIGALKTAGYGTQEYPMPVITGQDCDLSNVKAIAAGEQSMSVFKDTRALAEVVAGMADTFVKGGTPEYNNTDTYDNGAKVVPAYCLEPIAVTKDNYKEKLIDSGYYAEADLQ